MEVLSAVHPVAVAHPARPQGGGVGEGEVTSSPGCSGMRLSAEPGPCRPGGVDDVFRTSVDEPLRDTQLVSITRTPILGIHTHAHTHPDDSDVSSCYRVEKRKRREGSGGRNRIPYDTSGSS